MKGEEKGQMIGLSWDDRDRNLTRENDPVIEEEEREILPVSILGQRLPQDVMCLCGCYADRHEDAHGNICKGPCTNCMCEWFKAQEPHLNEEGRK